MGVEENAERLTLGRDIRGRVDGANDGVSVYLDRLEVTDLFVQSDCSQPLTAHHLR